jgi:serine/threonine-protein kinase
VLGPVFRALDPVQERMVGIKVFRLDLTPEQVEALAEQFSILVQQLPHHDGLVRPLAAGVEGAGAYLVTEYIASDSIDQRLRRKVPTPLEQALPMLTQVAAAMDHAAASGYYHGALHPRDVLVSTRGAVCLTGVGVIQALEAVGWRPPFRRPYAAPERLAGRRWDARADVFTLAVLAVELATGRRPLMPENGAALQWIAGEDADRVAAVRAAMARALNEDPTLRDASTGAWVTRLDAALNGELPVESDVVAIVPPTAIEEPVLTADDLPVEESVIALDTFPSEHEQDVDEPERIEPEPEIPAPLPGDAPVWEATDSVSEPSPLDRPLAGAAAAPSFAPRPDWRDSPDVLSAESLEAPATPVWPRAIAAGIVLMLIAGSAAYWFTSRGRAPADAGSTTPSTQAPTASDTQASDQTDVTLDTSETQNLQPPAKAPAAGAGDADAARPATQLPPPKAVPSPSPRARTPEQVRPVPRPTPARPPVAAAARASAVRDGRMLVRSSPADAVVRVDGIERGRTPLALRGLDYGSYRVAVALAGHVPAEREVSITRDVPAAALTFDLARAQAQGVSGAPPAVAGTPQTAASEPRATTTKPLPPPSSRPADNAPGPATSLEIVSHPPGARVFVDGQSIGAAPLRVSGLSPGLHQIRLEQAGYHPWSAAATVVSGRLTRVSASLEPSTR